jgi:hypothetical protein
MRSRYRRASPSNHRPDRGQSSTFRRHPPWVPRPRRRISRGARRPWHAGSAEFHSTGIELRYNAGRRLCGQEAGTTRKILRG